MVMIERPKRFTDWRFRLAVLAHQWEDRRWQLGITDCAQFAAAAITSQTGHRVTLPDYAGKGEKAAISGLASAVTAAADMSGYKITQTPLAGDVGAFFVTSRNEWTLGVVNFDISAVWVPRKSGLQLHLVDEFDKSTIYAVGA
jgi:hypothetical protein